MTAFFDAAPFVIVGLLLLLMFITAVALQQDPPADDEPRDAEDVRLEMLTWAGGVL